MLKMRRKGFSKILLLTLVLIIKSYLAVENTNLKYKARINYKFKVEYVLEEIRAASYAECLVQCSMWPGCISASFKSSPNNCLLSANDTIDDLVDSPGIPIALEYAFGWKTTTQVKYPVFHALGNYQRYSMTYEQAIQQCIDYGTSIASLSDLLEARSMGYEFCGCSWISDRTNGLVLQSFQPECWYTFSEGYLPCPLATANVFCKLK